MSETAWRSRAAPPLGSKALAPPACMSSSRSAGRGRLPAWVVRIRSVLCFTASLIKRYMRGGDDVLPTLGFFAKIGGGRLRRAADRFGRQVGKAFPRVAFAQHFVDAGIDAVDHRGGRSGRS